MEMETSVSGWYAVSGNTVFLLRGLCLGIVFWTASTLTLFKWERLLLVDSELP